jgi:hypothetical protein
MDHVPDETEAMLLYSHTLSWFSARASIPKKDRILISTLNIAGNYNNRAGLLFSPSMVGCLSIGEREFFFDLNAANQCMKQNKIGRYQFQELLNPEILPKYHPHVNADLL